MSGHFYSHAHAGRDDIPFYLCILTIKFLLTRPRRAWQKYLSFLTGITNFYSHAHAGRDKTPEMVYDRIINFYSHAHAGRDGDKITQKFFVIISTHTPTQGVTFVITRKSGLLKFLLTRPRRAWQLYNVVFRQPLHQIMDGTLLHNDIITLYSLKSTVFQANLPV